MRTALYIVFAIASFVMGDIALANHNYTVLFHNKTNQAITLPPLCVTVMDSNGTFSTCFPNKHQSVITLPAQGITHVLVEGPDLSAGYGLSGNKILIKPQKGSWSCSGSWNNSNTVEFFFFNSTRCEIGKS